MKKLFLFFAVVALVFGAASCQKENFQKDQAEGEEKIDYSDDPMGVIKVYIKKDDTKMAFDEKDNKLYRSWEVDDVIDGCTKVGEVYKTFAYTVAEVGVDKDEESGEEKPYIILKKTAGEAGVPSSEAGTKVNFVYAPGAVSFDATTGACSLDLSKQDESHIPAVMVASGTVEEKEGEPHLELDFENIAAVLEIKDYSMSSDAEDWTSFGSVTVDALTKSTLTINDGVVELGTCAAGKATVTVSERRTKGAPVFVAILPGDNVDIKARFNDVVAGNEKIGNFVWAPTSKVNVSRNGFARIKEKTFDFAPVAQIGDEKYGYISKAFAEAQTGNTITLLDDCLAEEKLLIDKSDVILDLAGKTLSCQKLGTVDCNITVNGENTFTIMDTDSDKKGRIDVSSQSSGIWPVCAENGATLVIDGGAIAGKAVDAAEEGAIKVSNSNLTIKGGSISGSSESTIDIENTAEAFNLFEIFDGKVSSQYKRSLKIAGNIDCAFLGGEISSLMKFADVSSNTIQFTRLKIDNTENDYGKPQAIMAGSTVYVNQQENLGDKSYSAIYAHYGEVFVLSGTLENKGQNGGVIKSYGAKVTVRPASLPTWEWLKEDYQLDDRKSTEETKNLHIKCPSSCSYGLFFTNGKNGEITAYKYIDTQAGGNGTGSAGLIARVSSEGGTITIAGGTYYGGADNGTVYVQGGNFKVTGGSLYGHGGTSSGGPKGTIYCNGDEGTVTIGGSSSSTANIYGDGWGGAIRVDKGTVNIEAKASVKCYYTSSSTNPQVRIKGGEFNLHDGVIGSSGSTKVDDVSNYCYRGISLSKGTFNMTGGELRAYNSCIYCDGDPTIAISGGLLRNGTSSNSCFQITGSSSGAKITISPAKEGQYPQIYQYKADSGTQASPVKLTSGGARPKITGGYFYVKSADVLSDYLASGYTTEKVTISSKTYYHVIEL